MLNKKNIMICMFKTIVTDTPSIMIYIDKIENRITFKIETVYYLELLTLGTLKVFRSTKIKIKIKMVKMCFI